MSTLRRAAVTPFAAMLLAVPASAAEPSPAPRLGAAVAPEIVKRWATTVYPDGRGLPAGKGTAAQGKAVYTARCISCHGPDGRGETAEELVGRDLPLTDPDTAQTIGSYWPYATSLFDYTRRAMPMEKPGSLTADEVYAVSAYLLHLNGIIGPDDEMNAVSLPQVRMPNRGGFVPIDAPK